MKELFIKGIPIKRSSIHDQYGGNRQSGISPSAQHPYIFIFSGDAGKQHGYKDEWLNEDIFQYTGEGQAGDMQYTKGNLALRDHLQNSKRVFLFEYISKGIVKYISEMIYHDSGYFETHDSQNKIRIGIKFFLKRIGTILTSSVESEPFESLAPIIKIPNETERKGLVTSRIGQGAYRKSVIYRWEGKCAVTGFDKLNVLIASHIVPWKESNNEERLDVNNGILLSPTYDALFDNHLISFENSGKIILSDRIESMAYHKIGVTGKEIIVKLHAANLSYLERHRDRFSKK
jgi:predicted restriction endonuclease